MKTFLLAEENSQRRFRESIPRNTRIVGWKSFAQSAVQTRDETLWITESLEELKRVFESLDENFFRRQTELRKRIRIFLIADAPLEVQRSLEGFFKEAIVLRQDSALPIEELIE